MALQPRAHSCSFEPYALEVSSSCGISGCPLTMMQIEEREGGRESGLCS